MNDSDRQRSERLRQEYLQPQQVLREDHIDATIVVFGSARFVSPEQAEHDLRIANERLTSDPDNKEWQGNAQRAQIALNNSVYYQQAREFGALVTRNSLENPKQRMTIVSGGGPGVMEAANRGAMDVGGDSIGFNIVLPREQQPNPYITPRYQFQFHYFAIRKMHFLQRAHALVVFPGGYGTLDELFETLTLVQTEKSQPVPVILVGKSFWQRLINFEVLLELGTIEYRDLELFTMVDSAEEAWQVIQQSQHPCGRRPCFEG